MNKVQKTKRSYSKSSLTPAKKKFAKIYADTDNGTKAVKIAFKANNLTELSARNKASTLLTNPNVKREIDIQKAKLEVIANKAVKRIDELVESDNEQIATTNSWKVIEQVHGKAVTKSLNLSAEISIEDMLNNLT